MLNIGTVADESILSTSSLYEVSIAVVKFTIGPKSYRRSLSFNSTIKPRGFSFWVTEPAGQCRSLVRKIISHFRAVG
jgi:hypothetical protein